MPFLKRAFQMTGRDLLGITGGFIGANTVDLSPNCKNKLMEFKAQFEQMMK